MRKFLLQQKVIDKTGSAINRDKIRVYSAGDLIDGNYNKAGDILNLEFAEEWFDGIVLGNHEYAFIGGRDFGSRRKHDRRTMQLLLGLIDKGIYVPSILVKGHLLTHAGLSDRFEFETADDAHEYIKRMWQLAPDLDEEIAIFDWKFKTSTTGDPVGGIFELDWIDKRNPNFPQVVGHTTYYTGPIIKEFEDSEVVHWNIDVGGKTGKCVGGIILDDENDKVEAVFWGERFVDPNKIKKTVPPAGEKMTSPPAAKIPAGFKGELAPGKTSNTILPPAVPVSMPGYTSIPNISLDDLDMTIIEDPEILEVFMEEVQKGNTDLRLKDMIL